LSLVVPPFRNGLDFGGHFALNADGLGEIGKQDQVAEMM
jgi:hypothetical protein